MTIDVYLILLFVWPLVGSKPVKRSTCLDNPSFQFVDKEEDLSEIYAAASHVFEAVVTSQSPPDNNFVFGVNLRLRKCFKGKMKSILPEHHLRMNFSLSTSHATACLVQAKVLMPNKKYIVFAKEVRNRQFWPLMRPVEKTRSLARRLRNLSCKTCGNLTILFEMERKTCLFYGEKKFDFENLQNTCRKSAAGSWCLTNKKLRRLNQSLMKKRFKTELTLNTHSVFSY